MDKTTARFILTNPITPFFGRLNSLRCGHVERRCGGLLHKYALILRKNARSSSTSFFFTRPTTRSPCVSRLYCRHLQLCDVGHLGCDLHSYGTVHNDAPDDVRSDLTLTRVHLRFVRIPQSECAAGTSSSTVGATSSAVCVGTSLPKSGQRMVLLARTLIFLALRFLPPRGRTRSRRLSLVHARTFPRAQLARLAPSAQQLGPRPARVRRRCGFALGASHRRMRKLI